MLICVTTTAVSIVTRLSFIYRSSLSLSLSIEIDGPGTESAQHSTTDRIIKKRGATLCDCISYIGSTTFVHVFVYCTHTGRQAGTLTRAYSCIIPII